MLPIRSRVQKYRQNLRAAGLRPVQIWVPDTRRPGFEQECRRQCRIVALSDAADPSLQRLMDESLIDVKNWTE